LKIEFSRISKDGRLTLVIDPMSGVEIQTYYGISARTDLEEAIEDLRLRENTTKPYIGRVVRDPKDEETSDRFCGHEEVQKWLLNTSFDAAVWTALNPNFLERRHLAFSPESAIAYLQSLSKERRITALNYVRSVPNETSTPARKAILKAFGLTNLQTE